MLILNEGDLVRKDNYIGVVQCTGDQSIGGYPANYWAEVKWTDSEPSYESTELVYPGGRATVEPITKEAAAKFVTNPHIGRWGWEPIPEKEVTK